MRNTILTMAFTALVFLPLATFAEDSYPPIEKNIVTYDADETFNFTFDGDIILEGSIEEAEEKVAELAEYLTTNPERKIRVEGFTDETGSNLYNLGLSYRRVAGVKKMLVDQGVNRNQIIGVPYGELNELENGHSDEAWAANRRIRILLISL